MKDVEIYKQILEKKYPEHYFDLNIRGDVLFVYGEDNDTLYEFCNQLSESMCKPVKRIAFIKS